MKSTMDLSDLLGLHLLMMRIPGRGEFKVLVAGLGETFLRTLLIVFLWYVIVTIQQTCIQVK